MPWHITYQADTQIVETSYVGRLLPAELYAAVSQTIAAGRDHQARRFLGDCTALQGGHSILDLYELANLIIALRPGPIKEAVLLPQLAAIQEEVQFWETTCVNRGFNVRLFADKAAAVRWLCDSATD